MGFLFATNSGATGATGATGPAGTSIVDEVFNAEDDGFDTSVLNAKWTQLLGGTNPTILINSQEARSHYLAKFAGAAIGSAVIFQSYAPAGDFALTAKFASQFRGAANSIIDLTVQDTPGTGQVYVRLVGSTANSTVTAQLVGVITGTPTVAGSVAAIGLTGATYVHLQRVGTLFTGLVSRDGVSWNQVATLTKTLAIVNLVVTIQQVTGASKETVGVDWIRRDWFVW